MIHSYQITGMSCNGCRLSVEKALNTIDGIEATVSLNPPIATVTMQDHIRTERLQEALTEAGNYTLSIAGSSDTKPATQEKPGKNSCC